MSLQRRRQRRRLNYTKSSPSLLVKCPLGRTHRRNNHHHHHQQPKSVNWKNKPTNTLHYRPCFSPSPTFPVGLGPRAPSVSVPRGLGRLKCPFHLLPCSSCLISFQSHTTTDRNWAQNKQGRGWNKNVGILVRVGVCLGPGMVGRGWGVSSPQFQTLNGPHQKSPPVECLMPTV